MYHKYVEELRSICEKRNFELKQIGAIGENGEYPMFSVVLNGVPNPKKVVCFMAGTHGEEIAGPLAILEFLRTCRFRKTDGVKVIIFPVANPSGFDKGRRRNYKGQDVGVHFCDKETVGETKILYDAIRGQGIFFFHDLHEDPDETRFYLYNFARSRLKDNASGNSHTPPNSFFQIVLTSAQKARVVTEEQIYRDILELGRYHFEINRDIEIDKYRALDGIVANRWDGSLEDRLFRDGVPFSMCTETPLRAPLESRVALSVEIMNKVIDFCRSEMRKELAARNVVTVPEALASTSKAAAAQDGIRVAA